MSPFTEADWRVVAEAHGGDSFPDGKVRMIDLGRRPKVGRTAKAWRRYSDALVNLCMLAGRGNAGLRMHVGYSGNGRCLTRDAK